MSDAEAMMWTVEKDPALRSDFCNLTVLERAPEPARLQRKLAAAIDAIPRLAQRVVSAPLRLAPPEWLDDPDFDLDYHVRTVALPAPGGMRELLDLAAALADAPFDRSRPLWEFTIIDGIEGGRAAMLQKVHHTITDGVGGLKLSLSIVDFEPDPPAADAEVIDLTREVPVARTSPFDVLRGALGAATSRNVGAASNALASATRVATRPLELPERIIGASRVAASMRRQLLVADSARSDVLTGRSLRRRFDVCTLSLPAMSERAKQLGGTVNDLFVTGLTEAMRRYHQRLGSPCTELRMAMPVNTRERGDRSSANKFTPVRVLVPLVPDDPAARFPHVHDALRTAKGDAVRNVIDVLSGVVSLLPTSMLVPLARSQVRTIDFTASNLRGSPAALYLAGERILANYPLGPRTGSAFNATVMSYCDEMHVGCNIDPAAVTDVDTFMDDVASSFEDLTLEPVRSVAR
jgi:WS/DGAT/MGAT family acyltransferase